MPSRDRTWRTEIEFFLEDGISRKVAFYDGEATTSSLAYAAKSAEQLHQSTGDFAPLPSVRDDGALVLRWSQLWPDYTRSACPGVRAEIIAYLYRNGRLEIHSQARRVFLSRVNEIESGGEKYPLDVPVYSRTVSRLSNAEMEALLKSMKHDLATLQAEMKERNRIAERTLISTRHYELPQLDFVLRSENELVFFGQAPRQGPSNALEKELDRLVVQIRRLASAELGHRVFRCEQSAISY
jgi:hypothetical protein